MEFNQSVSSDFKFEKKQLKEVKAILKNDGYGFDAFNQKFYIKSKYGKCYFSQAEAYEKLAGRKISEVYQMLYKNGLKCTIANSGTLYLNDFDIRISNHNQNGYYHAEKFGMTKNDFVLGAFTNTTEVAEMILSLAK